MEQVNAAIQGGARIIQYRNKHQLDPDIALALAKLCRQNMIPLIINDSIELAMFADGVHLGKDDGDVAAARQTLGNNAIIGVSCYNDLQRAIEAEHAGADYIAFGSMFPSSTKPHAVPASLALLEQAASVLTIPIVAIGGITPQNAASVILAGAHAVAVINAVFAAPDITRAAQQFSALFTETKS